MPKTVNAAGVVGFLFALCGAGMLAAAMGTTQWLPGALEDCGIFQCCDSTNCRNLGWIPEDVTRLVTRSILFLACLLTAIALLVALAALCGKGNITSAGALNIVSGIVVLIGCGAYTGLIVVVAGILSLSSISVDSFGYSYYLCWASGVVLFIAGICKAKGKKKTTNTQVYPATMQAQMVWATGVNPRQGTITQPGQHQMALIKV